MLVWMGLVTVMAGIEVHGGWFGRCVLDCMVWFTGDRKCSAEKKTQHTDILDGHVHEYHRHKTHASAHIHIHACIVLKRSSWFSVPFRCSLVGPCKV